MLIILTSLVCTNKIRILRVSRGYMYFLSPFVRVTSYLSWLEHCAGVAEVMGSNPAEHTWTSSGAHVRQSIKFFRKCEDHSFNSSLNRACQTFLFFPFSFPEIRLMNNSQLTARCDFSVPPVKPSRFFTDLLLFHNHFSLFRKIN